MQLILRRRTFVVNRKLQFGILLTSLSYVLLLVVVVSTTLFAPLVLQLNSPDRNSTETSDAAIRLLYLHDTYWPPVLLTLVAIALHSVATSHRIAGPLYRFRRVCEAMTAGVVPRPVTLRNGDQLQAEMAAVNAMLEPWRTLSADAQRDAAALQEAVARYHELATATPATAAADAAWADVNRAVQQLRGSLGRITREETSAADPGAIRSGATSHRVGFTLVELLIVLALTGTLSAIALPMYSRAIQKARVTRAIGDLKNISLTITLWHSQRGNYPDTLAAAGCDMRDPWSQPYEYVKLAGVKGAKARKDKNLHPLNTDYDLWSIGPDGKTAIPLTANASRDDVIRASNGGFLGLAADY